MEEEVEDPLYLIFKKNSDGETTEELENIQKIPEFFNYLKNFEIPQQKKIYIIEQLQKKFNVNRYLMEYFSEIENKSIYIFIFDLFLSQEVTEELKLALLNFISQLINNIEIGKEVFQYIFQKLSKIYRKEENVDSDKVNNLLRILNAILGSTENYQKPRNYFTCVGDGQFILDCSEEMTIGYAFTIFLNFKIGISDINDIKRISNLVNINFSNETNLSINLEYPSYLKIKHLNQDFKKILQINEFILLFVTFITIPQFKSIKIILTSFEEVITP